MNKKRTILFADDSALMHRMITTMLEDTEFELVAHASSGEEAIEQFIRTAPDMVVLDIVMPGVGGIHALKEIIRISPDMPVIMASSMGTEHHVTECLAAGAKMFIRKPYDADALLKCLRAVTAKH